MIDYDNWLERPYQDKCRMESAAEWAVDRICDDIGEEVWAKLSENEKEDMIDNCLQSYSEPDYESGIFCREREDW